MDTRKIAPGAGYFSHAIYISAGRDDRIGHGRAAIQRPLAQSTTGFQRIRIGTFHGGHEVNDAQTSIALRWFVNRG